MNCPECGLYHPLRYDQCVSCGCKFNRTQNSKVKNVSVENSSNYQTKNNYRNKDLSKESEEYEESEENEKYNNDTQSKNYLDNEQYSSQKNSVFNTNKNLKSKKSNSNISISFGIILALGILLSAAGGTFFFLSRPPESERLLQEGLKQLNNGQFAFAQKTLEQALAVKPKDTKILLTLARAYVGTDQVEKAWTCISQVQSLGQGNNTDPQLCSELAKFYIQHNQYARAADLLRPLANTNVTNKKLELADLDALWGDESLSHGDTAQALKCWEEIKKLGVGARFSEVDTRLASIYQKMANEQLAHDDLEAALSSLNNLNNLAASPETYERVSDLYAKQGKLDLAIDQLKKAQSSGSGSHELNKKLASLLAKRGKELLDKGDSETGYAYLQQAKSIDTQFKIPTVAIRNIKVTLERNQNKLRINGEAWNPGPHSVNLLKVRAELFDKDQNVLVWTRDENVIDEFVPALSARESKSFEISGNSPTRADGNFELKIYLDGSLYKVYPIGNNTKGSVINSSAESPDLKEIPVAPHFTKAQESKQEDINTGQINSPQQQIINNAPNTNLPINRGEAPSGMSPEERTLKDLE